jgi:hypothetical protein
MHTRNALLVASVAALLVACGSASSPPTDTQNGNDTSAGDPTEPAPTAADKTKAGASGGGPAATAGGGGGAFACPYTGAGIDVSAFPVCRDTGRCIPDKAFPADQAAQKSRLAACPGGFCVPEAIVKSQNNALPKSCRSFAGLEGRCTSMVFPDIEKQKDSLPQDACEATERCAPCFDPSGKATGACSSVSCDAPKEPFKPFPACCSSNGKSRGSCLPSTSLPAVAASGLEKKECPGAADLCVPNEEIDPTFVNPKCTASSLLGSYDGVCISTCVKMDFLTQLGTAQGTCSADSFCAPCKNPLNGAPTGAPGCAP